MNIKILLALLCLLCLFSCGKKNDPEYKAEIISFVTIIK